MTKFLKSIVVPATPEQVFDLIDDSTKLPEIWHNLSNIREFHRLPNGGTSFKFDYMMAGIKISGTSMDLVHERPHRLVTHTTGGVSSTFNFSFTANADNTETTVVIEVEYEIPLPLIGRMAESIIHKINETDIVYVLNYLKMKFK